MNEVAFLCNGTDLHEIPAKTSVTVLYQTLIEEFQKFLANVNSHSRSLDAIARPSVVCLSSVCNARAPYSGG